MADPNFDGLRGEWRSGFRALQRPLAEVLIPQRVTVKRRFFFDRFTWHDPSPACVPASGVSVGSMARSRMPQCCLACFPAPESPGIVSTHFDMCNCRWGRGCCDDCESVTRSRYSLVGQHQSQRKRRPASGRTGNELILAVRIPGFEVRLKPLRPRHNVPRSVFLLSVKQES